MQLDRIAFLMKYVNGNVNDRGDDIIRYSELYDYICRILDRIIYNINSSDTLEECIYKETETYEEKISGARRRLNVALEIILTAYYAALIKASADYRLEALYNS